MTELATASVNIDSGKLTGLETHESRLYRGIPYAAAPTGDLRFEAPRPVESWAGVRQATAVAPGAIQPWRRDDPWNGYFNPIEQSPNCLTLQVHAPLEASRAPVVVWIHGGAFITGVGSAPAHRADTWVRDGIVHVAVNYRLGLDGFALFEDSVDAGADNLGLRDQVAALEWVQRNIAAFGGDPSNVTIMGQSAGAVSVAMLMASPLAQGLFHRAIVQSGIPTASFDPDTGATKAGIAARHVGRRPVRDDLRSLTDDQTRAATQAAWRQTMSHSTIHDVPFAFSSTHGTPSLPVPVLEALETGAASSVPLLIGGTADELAGTIVEQRLTGPGRGILLKMLLPRIGISSALLASYRDQRATRSNVVALSGLLSDALFGFPSIRMAETHRGPTFAYRFTWQSPLRPAGMGADHTFDIPFAQDDFASLAAWPIGRQMLGPSPSAELATAMHGAFTRFIATGDPGWTPYDAERRRTMRFDVESSETTGPAPIAP